MSDEYDRTNYIQDREAEMDERLGDAQVDDFLELERLALRVVAVGVDVTERKGRAGSGYDDLGAACRAFLEVYEPAVDDMDGPGRVEGSPF